MSKRRRGQFFEITEGDYIGQKAFMYYDEQREEFAKAGKLKITIAGIDGDVMKDEGKVLLIKPEKLRLIGFFD